MRNYPTHRWPQVTTDEGRPGAVALMRDKQGKEELEPGLGEDGRGWQAPLVRSCLRVTEMSSQ